MGCVGSISFRIKNIEGENIVELDARKIFLIRESRLLTLGLRKFFVVFNQLSEVHVLGKTFAANINLQVKICDPAKTI